MTQGATTTKDELINEFQAEYDKIQARVHENQQLIDQTQLEVDQMRERNVTIGARLNRVEENFDTVPRADIRSAYDDAMAAKTRLLSMQGQLDKLKGNQEELRYVEGLLKQLLNRLSGVRDEDLPASMGGGRVADLFSGEGGLSTKAIVSMVEAQEDERQRLARQMHDGPAQSLTNFILQAEICQRLFDRDIERAKEELNNLKAAASSTFQKVRDFIFDLRPMMLDDLGLVPTVRRYVEAYQEKTSIDTQLNILGDERRLPAHIEVMMFRSVQSIMGNARDNLAAHSVSIVLDVGAEWLKSTIEHDGRGFEPIEVFGMETREDASGLRTLRDRIELVGGMLEVYGGEDEMSRFTISLPLVEPESIEPEAD